MAVKNEGGQMMRCPAAHRTQSATDRGAGKSLDRLEGRGFQHQSNSNWVFAVYIRQIAEIFHAARVLLPVGRAAAHPNPMLDPENHAKVPPKLENRRKKSCGGFLNELNSQANHRVLSQKSWP
jgi:hypothetical protein